MKKHIIEYLNNNNESISEFLSDSVGVRYIGYSSEHEYMLYEIAKTKISSDKFTFYSDFVTKEYQEPYISLLHEILAGAKYKGKELFDYGSSPRGLWCADKELGGEWLDIFKYYLEKTWEEEE